MTTQGPHDSSGHTDSNLRVQVGQFGAYYLIERIGQGGMAEVWRAVDATRREVAVKICHAEHAGEREFVDSFLREARLASLVVHPNVVRLLAAGAEDGRPYLAMEFLKGLSVRDAYGRLAAENMVIDEDVAMYVVAQSALALHAAHIAVDEHGRSMGLMHRDVSPHNIFLTFDGGVKVLDFGIAKGIFDLSTTRTGFVKGKVSYLSPEQIDPLKHPDYRADLFSLGVVAWELLTGERLFRKASDVDTLTAIRAMVIPTPSARRPGVDPRHDSVIMRMLSKDPAKRAISGAEIAREIAQIAADRRVDDQPQKLAMMLFKLTGQEPTRVASRLHTSNALANWVLACAGAFGLGISLAYGLTRALLHW